MNGGRLSFPDGHADTWDEMDKIIFGDFANKERLKQLSTDPLLVSALAADDSFPDQSELILPHSIFTEDQSGSKRKGRRLLGEDHRYSAFKYKQFYKDLQTERDRFSYESPLKQHLNSPLDSRDEERHELHLREMPRVSMMSTGKQKMYIRLKAKLGKTKEHDEEKNKLFKVLHRVVQKEQRDYVSFCLRQAKYVKTIDYEAVLPGLITYIERALFHRQHSVPADYDALYHLHSAIDFDVPFKKEIVLQPEMLLLALGQVPYTDMSSNFYHGASLEEFGRNLEFLLPSNDQLGHRSKEQNGPCVYKTPVSCDPNALHFAAETEAEIVTCSSVMELLTDVHPYSLHNSATRRDIPVMVKLMQQTDGTTKKVVFLDKALPPLEMTLYDKKIWACRRAVRELFASWDVNVYRFDDSNDGGRSNVAASNDNTICDDVEMQDEDSESECFPLPPPPNQNVTYGLYSLCSSDGEGRKINLVVRSSYHAYEMKNGRDKPSFLHLSVKLEHQPEYGAQCTTISEISREWMALKLRKGAALARVRVDAKTLKVIQVEKKSMKAVQQECRVRGMSIEGRAASLHHTFSKLSKLEPGSYLLQLIPIEGLARLLEHDTSGTNLRGGSYFNLHLHFRRANHLIGPMSHVPYSLIDPLVATPYHTRNERIPATFLPKCELAKTPPAESLPGTSYQTVPTLADMEVEPDQDADLDVSDSESLVEWMADTETRSIAKQLEEELVEDKSEKQGTFLMPNREDPDIMRIIMEMQNLKDQILTTNVWLEHEWQDHKFRWDPSEYGGVTELYVPSEHIWLPDIVLYNNADGEYVVTTMTKAVLHYTGKVQWTPPAIFKSSCEIDVRYFPFDHQTCFMKFGSWTYDGFQIDLKHINQVAGDTGDMVEVGIDLREYYPSVEWDILGVPAESHKKYYPCCAEPYPDIFFNITLRRKTLFYTVNLIVPCVGISYLSVLVFYLPADSGEKVALCISILLSQTMFFLLISEIIPSTSLALPLLGKYLLFTMVLVGLSVVITIIVLNVHYRKPSTHKMAQWVRAIFIRRLPKLLLMRVPEQLLEDMASGTTINDTMMRRSAAARQTTAGMRPVSPPLPLSNGLSNRFGGLSAFNGFSSALDAHSDGSDLLLDGGHRRKYPFELEKAIHNVMFIQHHMQRQDEFDAEDQDWGFVAMVLDRLFLWVFNIASVAGIVLILFEAPALYDNTEPIDIRISEVYKKQFLFDIDN